jgi:hypothetical protein
MRDLTKRCVAMRKSKNKSVASLKSISVWTLHLIISHGDEAMVQDFVFIHHSYSITLHFVCIIFFRWGHSINDT